MSYVLLVFLLCHTISCFPPVVHSRQNADSFNSCKQLGSLAGGHLTRIIFWQDGFRQFLRFCVSPNDSNTRTGVLLPVIETSTISLSNRIAMTRYGRELGVTVIETWPFFPCMKNNSIMAAAAQYKISSTFVTNVQKLVGVPFAFALT